MPSNSEPPLSAQPHRQKILWLHWVLANATGLGTYVAAAHFAIRMQREPGDGVPIWIALGNLTSLIILFGGVGVVGLVQRTVLRGAGLQADYWAWMLYPGLVVGGVCGLLGNTPALLLSIVVPRYGVELAVVCGTFSFGAGLGWMQSLTVFNWVWRQRCYWSLASGLGLMVLAVVVALFEDRLLGPHTLRTFGVVVLAATVAAGLYGSVTGVALVWLRPRDPTEDFPRDDATSDNECR
ncbi:hypothetical protein NA78x_005492 [Anatilimnocola sp. NA78]|uniref:hypothetical protein n=1 Tax=Anatilimnocola sp. NA78 TaxID=3415683 RepID=UPI003CE4F6D5